MSDHVRIDWVMSRAEADVVVALADRAWADDRDAFTQDEVLVLQALRHAVQHERDDDA